MQTIFSSTRPADDRAIEVIEQMIDVDGSDGYDLQPIYNGSGRTVGIEFYLTEEQAEFLDDVLAQQKKSQS